ncbi:hypothetical protein [Saccharothrix xinjiangensis]|uniref:Uncharacterized protein n=1 Tax=Saccharothrix xinjiangensis TaxID=204798 RepID=A0ABV9Y2J1_9PSEU
MGIELTEQGEFDGRYTRVSLEGRHLVYGGMDHPRRGEACEVGTFYRELIYCTGGSDTVVVIGLADFSSYRIIDERPDLRHQAEAGRRAARQVLDALTRGSAWRAPSTSSPPCASAAAP